jgi:hypothetical protein
MWCSVLRKMLVQISDVRSATAMLPAERIG